MRLVDLKTRMLMADLAGALTVNCLPEAEIRRVLEVQARYSKWKDAQAAAAKRGKVIGRPPTELKPEQRAILEEWATLTPRPGLKWLALQLGLSVGKVHSLAKTVLPKMPIVGNEPVPVPPRLSPEEAFNAALGQAAKDAAPTGNVLTTIDSADGKMVFTEYEKPFGQIFDEMERQTGKRCFEYTPPSAPTENTPNACKCGGAPTIGYYDDSRTYDVECESCHDRTKVYPITSQAIEAWNRGETTTT